LTRRSSLGLGYRYYTTRPSDFVQGHDSQRAFVRFRHTLGRNLSYILGYGRETIWYGSASTTQHLIDVGIDWGLGGEISITRRLLLGVSTGTALFSDGHTRRFDVTGTASLTYLISRQWQANTSYYRGVGFTQTFLQPTYSDSLAADLTGQLGSRVSLQARTGVVKGRIGLSGPTNHYQAYQSAVTASFQVGTHVGLNAGYVYYRYGFDGATHLPLGFGTDIRRHALQVGTSVALPVIGGGRSRRTNASR
jgi:hypothetical protein